MVIVITGGSGFIGSQLSKRLIDLGHTVIVVDIVAPSFTNKEMFFINCDITKQALPYGILEKTDAVVNLVGKPIFTKWTKRAKKEIEISRAESTKHVVESIAQATSKPSCFICASSIAFYGDTGEDIVDEQAPQGEGFLADLVSRWELIARGAQDHGVRVVCVRTAPVLGSVGILKQLKMMARFGFLLKLRKQDFWMSWIHEEDIINTYIFALETKTVQGVFNACAPEPIKHSIFMRSLSRALNRRVIGSMPRFLTKRIFGDLFFEITKNQKVTPRRLIDKGFVFKFPTIGEAFEDIFNK